MKVGDLVKVNLESGHSDIGLILKVEDNMFDKSGNPYYEVACQKSKTTAIATECMLEVISESR